MIEVSFVYCIHLPCCGCCCFDILVVFRLSVCHVFYVQARFDTSTHLNISLCKSQHIYCFFLLFKYVVASVQVWSLEQPEWTCKIDEGSAGLVDACWSPDGRHILTTAEFNVTSLRCEHH